MSDESAQASLPPAGPKQPKELRSFRSLLKPAMASNKRSAVATRRGRRIAELLAELLDDTSDEAP
jgi:hypothetical protein